MHQTFAVGPRPWEILLVGGASGSGKSQLSYALAHAYGVAVTEIDDLYTAMRSMTTPAQQPTLHFWDTHPEAHTLTPEQIVELHCSVCQIIEPVIETVIANHVGSGTPIILEGDYLLPEGADRMMKAFTEKVNLRAVFVSEGDERQLMKNFLVREPKEGEQAGRARVSALLNNKIERECRRLDLPLLLARPWATLLERAVGMTTT